MRNRTRQNGNAMLEYALVLVPWMALICGITDFGFGIFIRNAFQHAVREGVRYAVTYRLEPSMSHDASIKAIVKRNAVGFLSNASGDARIHIRYYEPDTLAETINNWPGNLIEVSIEDYQWSWMAPLMHSAEPMKVTARSMDRMEGLPAGMAPPAR